MSEFTIQTSGGSGDTENIRIVPLKNTGPGAIPLSLLQSYAKRGGSNVEKCVFVCGKSHRQLGQGDGDIHLVRVFEGNRTTSNLGIIQHLNGQAWTLTKLDKNIKIKDVKGFPERTTVSQITTTDWLDTEQDYIQNRESLFNACKVSPVWEEETVATLNKLDLDPPKGAEVTATNDEPNTIPIDSILKASELSDPSEVLEKSYLETLYLSKTPLVYFAKSTLSRIRSQCKTGDKLTYLTRAIDVLNRRVITVQQLDSKHEQEKMIRFVREEEEGEEGITTEHCKLSEKELKLLEIWKDRLDQFSSNASLKNELSNLKIREIQLQVVILLEILTLKVRAGTFTDSGKDTATKNAEEQNKPVSKPQLVRKKKKHTKNDPEKIPSTTNKSSEELVDIFFDRLCIWQALYENPIVPSTSQSATKKDQGNTRDLLQTFCAEVILPFFSYRLPEKTRQMVKKAQGRSIVKKTHRKRHSKEHTVAEEEAGQKDSLTYDNDDEGSSSQLPNDTQEPISLTQEDSFSLSAPTELGGPSKSQRSSSSQVVRGALATSTKTQYLQERRQVSVKNQPKPEELASAISNIAKPNRTRVSQEFADSKPLFNTNARKKKATKSASMRNSAAVVQVAAAQDGLSTPARRRRTTQLDQQPDEEGTANDEIISTPMKKVKMTDEDVYSTSVIRGTPIRSTPGNDDGDKENDYIAETPIKSTPQGGRTVNFTNDNDYSPIKNIGSFQNKLAKHMHETTTTNNDNNNL